MWMRPIQGGDLWLVIRALAIMGPLGRTRQAPRPYQVTGTLMDQVHNPAAKLMHCLPAFHDRDTIKAVLVSTLG
jgi:ornithine carbamoyltransferase